MVFAERLSNLAQANKSFEQDRPLLQVVNQLGDFHRFFILLSREIGEMLSPPDEYFASQERHVDYLQQETADIIIYSLGGHLRYGCEPDYLRIEQKYQNLCDEYSLQPVVGSCNIPESLTAKQQHSVESLKMRIAALSACLPTDAQKAHQHSHEVIPLLEDLLCAAMVIHTTLGLDTFMACYEKMARNLLKYEAWALSWEVIREELPEIYTILWQAEDGVLLVQQLNESQQKQLLEVYKYFIEALKNQFAQGWRGKNQSQVLTGTESFYGMKSYPESKILDMVAFPQLQVIQLPLTATNVTSSEHWRPTTQQNAAD